MRRPRLTTRRLTALVAVAGVAAFVWVQGERNRQRFVILRRTASMHRDLAFAYRGTPPGMKDLFTAQELRAGAHPSKVMAAYHDAMHDKYRRAMSRPWLPVPPDPPPPE